MRLAWVERVFLIALAGLAVALALFQLAWGPSYRRIAEQNRIRLMPLPAVRGSILDRHGAALAEDQLSFNVAVIPQEVRDPASLWGPLSRRLGASADRLQRAYRRHYTAPFAPAMVARDIEMASAFALEEQRIEWPGVVVLPAPRRRYPLGEAEGAIVGYLGMADPAAWKTLQAYGYHVRDWVGKSGIERLYDAALHGINGGVQVEVDHRGRLVRQLGLKPPVRGQNITVTLDAALQQHCYRLLAGRRGSILVMALDTGELWGAVSSPGFDPEAFVDPDRDATVEGYLADDRRPLFNRAVAGAVPPGSVFKIVTAYAGLSSQKASPATTYQCPGQFQLGNVTFDCWYAPGHGPQTVTDALRHSCNVFFYQMGLRVGPAALAASARLFGYGQPSRVDLPGEAGGLVPDPTWKQRRWRQPWFPGETVNVAIGQGALLVTPMQVLRMTAFVARDGRAPQPHLLKAIEGHPVGAPPETPAALDQSALSVIRQGMEAVIMSEDGTGRLARVAGFPAAGKTGTAQAGEGWPHAWFCGYAPIGRPQVAVVVFVEHGGKGGEVAAGIAGQIFEALAAHPIVESSDGSPPSGSA
ncbi:MAG: penicillin-binding protein 2 [Candidatus Omnitrophica bacterium]|nr:penicillin-binding protein 2 [Candidatus Omnitrophota bacterium]